MNFDAKLLTFHYRAGAFIPKTKKSKRGNILNFGTSPKIQLNDNVFEFIEFTATRAKTTPNSMLNKPITYGVNVEKVKEVIRLPAIVPCLSDTPELIGVFNLRGKPIPVIHLATVLGHEKEEITTSHQIIVTEFSKRFIGFIVAQTKRIRRVNGNKVIPPSSTAFNTITGMMCVENNDFIFILDFEKILFDIENQSHTKQENPAFSGETNTQELSTIQKPTVIVVDDSPTARLAVTGILRSMDLEVIKNYVQQLKILLLLVYASLFALLPKHQKKSRTSIIQFHYNCLISNQLKK